MRLHNDGQQSFADIEIKAQDIKLDGILQAIDDFLLKNAVLVSLVFNDLISGLDNPDAGRKGLDAEKVLRSFILRKIKNWSLRELRERIKNGLDLRKFTRFRFDENVPDHKNFSGAFNRLTPATVYALVQAIVKAAKSLGLEDGNKVRLDCTVVETDIHYPTDSGLLWDCVRVLTRLVSRLGELAPHATDGFSDRTKRAKRRWFEINRMTEPQRKRSLVRKYQDLISVTLEVMEGAKKVVEEAKKCTNIDITQQMTIDGLSGEIMHYAGLTAMVIDQAQRRVLGDEDVPAEQKITSIFEPHTDIIRRGKIRNGKKITEFGHKVFLAESKSGIITDYQILDGNPNDDTTLIPWLQRHKELFGHAPELLAADRGFFTEENKRHTRSAGVKLTSIPQKGGKKKHWKRVEFESSKKFKKAQAFRAGVEGRISVLQRGRGMKRCHEEGKERFDVSVGLAVLANNLLQIGRLLAEKNKKKR